MVGLKLLWLLAVIFAIGLVMGKEENRLVGGNTATERQFPYAVSLRRNGVHTCGGVIISRNYILTAARCVVKNIANNGIESYSPSEFKIRAGSLSLYDQGILAGVSEIKVHSNYTNMLNDVALLKLEEPLIFSDYIKPISLPYERPSLTAQVSVPGWGLHKTSGDVSRYLKYLSMEVVDNKECLSYLYGEDADARLLCLQFGHGGGICSGDIGGPAVYDGELVGLASFSIERCGSEYPDGFTNIAFFVRWIRENTDLK
uniref:Peptidase S1 domain-containing protein n=1 Tax=Musca domestica TaxID=7370 RepID=A0A1I8NC12_MUSDO